MTERKEAVPPEAAVPEEAGVGSEPPDLAQIEGAELLATHARPRLAGLGFGDEQIERWAQAYVREEGAGDVQGFVAWVAEQEAS